MKCASLSPGQPPRVTSTSNISAGGISVNYPEELPVGASLQVEIDVPPLNRSVRGEAVVTRCDRARSGNGFDLGLRFTRLAPQDRIALDEAIERFYAPPRQEHPSRERSPWWRKLFVFAVFLLAAASPAQGYQGPSYTRIEEPVVDIDGMSRTQEAPESLFSYFKERTQLGVGFDEHYTDNLLLEDNKKREEYISTLEGLLFFFDPRGILLYGLRWEANAFRYHHLNANAINHDFYTFADLDPGGRLQFRVDWQINATNSLLFGQDTTDILVRQTGTDFRRGVEHEWGGQARYALNDTNSLVSNTSYYVFDDQAQNDAGTDRKRFRQTLDLDHDLTRYLTVFGGYVFEDTFIPGAKLFGSESHGLRLGVRREISAHQKLDATFEATRQLFDVAGKAFTNFSFLGNWSHQLTPRTTLTFAYKDAQGSSFSGSSLRFRNQQPSLAIAHELNPFVAVGARIRLSEQSSSSSDSAPGVSSSTSRNKQYSLSCDAKWQIRDQTHVTAAYAYSRSKTRDTTNNTVTAGFETTF